MINTSKLHKLLEQEVNSGGGTKGFKNKIRSMLGITEQNTFDPDNREIDAKDVSFGEVAHSFLGRDIEDLGPKMEAARNMRLLEADGGVVLPSSFINISGFSDVVGGLLDAQILEAYQNPEFIGKSLITVRETRTNGGKLISVTNDGQTPDALAVGEELPAVGLKEKWVQIPANVRYGQAIQLDQHDILYDRSDKIQSAAANVGYAIARKIEQDIADMVLGISNSFNFMGTTGNTYLVTAGVSPMDYANSSQNPLSSWTAINDAVQVLESNVDPQTGFEISIDHPTVLVMPQQELTARTILRATEVISTSNGGAADTNWPLNFRRSENPATGFDLVRMSRIWYNRLVLASASGGGGVSTTNGPKRWHMGNFKRAFQWRQLIPFQTQSCPLSANEMRRGITLVHVAQESGVGCVVDPRYVYRGSLESL
jgi:hypothetical protein